MIRGPGRPDRYEIDGREIPSASTIGKTIADDGDGLLRWYAMGGVARFAERDRLAAIGSAVHDAIEATIAGDRIEADLCILSSPDVARAQAAMLNWMRWADVRMPAIDPVAVELPVISHRERVGGTVDMIARDHNSGVLGIVDWKTGAPRRGHLAQCAIYAILCEDDPAIGEPAEWCEIVSLRDTGRVVRCDGKAWDYAKRGARRLCRAYHLLHAAADFSIRGLDLDAYRDMVSTPTTKD